MLEIIEEQFNLVDKSSWGKGEWNQEPDIVKIIDGARCFMIRRGPPSLGHLCGYFGVFESHPFFEKDYNSIQKFDVEITFASKWYDQSGIVWWFGWDHAHWDDLSPGMLKHYRGSGTYKNIRYVMNEIEQINNQLIQIENGNRT
jgi:hypothetical protein